MSVDESNGTEAEKDNSDGKPGYLFDVVASPYFSNKEDLDDFKIRDLGLTKSCAESI